MNAKNLIHGLGFVTASLFLVAVSGPVRADEGYDPLRQITTQVPRSNVLCVLDVSGSMEWDLYGNGVGVNATGAAPTGAWSQTHSSCSGSNCKQWVYTLTISQSLASRINTVKNALGNTVSIYSEWTPPASYAWPNITWTGYSSVTGPTLAINHSATPVTYKYSWTVKYSSYHANPGQPLALTISDFINAGAGGVQLPPMDLIGQTGGPTGSINWGLATFSTSVGNCSSATLQAKIDSYDSGDVTAIETALKLNSAGGLNVGGSTPTKGGLAFAETVMAKTYSGGTITDYAGHSTTLPKDPKQNCGRLYGVVLVTDGLSNYCNPNDGNWISPCGGCPGPSCCDGGSSGYNCPNQYTSFAAGVSETIWNLAAPSHPHTWTIGVSNQVGKCELNYTAYKGRGDATAADAGVNAANDPYLPEGTPGTYDSNRDYAFFATNALALKAAFDKIVAGLGAGNYTTTAPSVSQSSVSNTNVAFLSSTEYPGWKGHLYAYQLGVCDLSGCNTSTFPLPDCDHCTGTVANPIPAPSPPIKLWDAGAVLAARTVGTDYTNGRSIWTWNPSSLSLVEIKAANAATLNSICGNCGITAQTVDFIRGNNGSGVKRAWLLGSSINSVPALIGPPAKWTSSNLANHAGFESTYGSRHLLAWLGSDDGMLHAFDAEFGSDGAEVIALLPPELLANQVRFYQHYQGDNNLVTGQPNGFADHMFGVASSPRFADVVTSSSGVSPIVYDYSTVLLLTEGQGHDYSSGIYSNAITAIDVTHPYAARTNVNGKNYGADPNYAPNAPVSVLWRNPRTYLSWSIPAMAGYKQAASFPPSGFLAPFGSGVDPTSNVSANKQGFLAYLDAATGASISSTDSLGTAASSLVGNQAFAHAVFWQRGAAYKEDNLATEIIQADLNGHIWTKACGSGGPGGSVTSTFNSGTVTTPYTIKDTASTPHPAPIYYSPAVSAYTTSTGVKYDIYAFASGSFYEKSQSINGPNTGTASGFIPAVYLYAVQLDNSNNPVQTTYWSVNLKDLVVSLPSTKAGPWTQVTASPLLVLPRAGENFQPFALFLLYDPQAGTCAGESYILTVTFDPSKLTTAGGVTPTVIDAGAGAAGGFTVSNNQVYVSHSSIGPNQDAQLGGVGGKIKIGTGAGTPVWWLELQ